MSIQIKRQGNLNATSCSSLPLKPNDLAYGELALDSKGYIYAGNGQGEVVSLVRAADQSAQASTAQYSLNSVNSNQLQGHSITTLSSGSSAVFADKIPYIQESGQMEISRYLDFHGDSISTDYSVRLDSGVPNTLVISGSSASTVTADYFDGNAKNSNTLAGQSIDYFAKATDFQNTPYLYSAIFYLTNWSGSGPFTQTASIIAEDGGPAISSTSKFLSEPMCQQTSNLTTNKTLQEVLNIINSGYLVLGDNRVSASVSTKPTADIQVYFLIRK